MDTPTRSHCHLVPKGANSEFAVHKRHTIPNKITIFLECSSIRGMQKITKANSLFLRILWISFVFSMTTLLIIASVFLVLDYVSYRTVWNTSTSLDDKTEFPAISFCSHNPFSIEANAIWKEENILTPTKFRHMLRNLSAKFIAKGVLDLAQINLFDDTETYYSTLDLKTATRLGHQPKMALYCLVKNDGFQIVAENCSLEKTTPFRLRRFSHRNYFNCYTVEGRPGKSTDNTQSIILLISITPSEDIPETKENLVMGMLTQGEGLKLVVHEQDTYPDIDKNGINVQPGKMNELIYSPVSWTRLNTPLSRCKLKQLPIRDLDRTYQYTFPQCLDATVQDQLIQECKCMSTLLPRPHTPPEGAPYCLNFNIDLEEIKKRFSCYDNFINIEAKKVKKRAQETVCLPRCDFYTYETSLTITKWKPTPFKFGRLNELYRAAEILSLNGSDSRVQQEYLDILNNPDRNLNNIAKFNKLFGDENRFTYLSLSRKNTDTTVKEEQLVLDIYILLSRIGGLCSLCIGLTTAFFIELVEFVYLAFRAEQQRRKLLSIRRRQHVKDAQCVVMDNGFEFNDVTGLCHNRYNNSSTLHFHTLPEEVPDTVL